MIGSRLIKSNDVAAGCVDIVDAYDPFGDSSGVALYQLNGNANDVSGNYNGTATNVTYGTGVFGQAGVFNGSSSRVTVGLNIGVTEVTISFWVKGTTNGSKNQRIIDSSSGNYGGMCQAILSTTGKLGISRGNNSSAEEFVVGNINIGDNAWHNCVVVLNGNSVKTYIDGQADLNTSTSVALGNDSTFNIGSDQAGVNGLSGSIDQVRIFNTALTPLEVEALYTEELCICGGTVDTLDILDDNSCIALYPLDGNANDLSGNYSGTPTNVSYGVGEFDLAGVFNGSTSKVILPTIDLTTFGDYTISLWAKGSSLASTATSCPISFVVNKAEILMVGGDINFQGNTNYLIVDYPFNSNDWYNIVLVNSGTSILGYINGVSQSGTTSASGSKFLYAATIGVRSLGQGDAFNGSIDQVRIFNKALNSTEVTTLYNETACANTTRTAGVTQILGDSSCVAYYKLDGDVTDETNTYNGTVVSTISYADGEFDYAADFDYSNNYINSNCDLWWTNVRQNISPLTISCWIKGQGYVGTNSGWIAMAGYGMFIRKTPNNEIQTLTFNSTGGALNTITSSSILNNTDWFHIVVVWNFKTIKLYINNQFIGEDTGTDNFVGEFPEISPNILIGKWNYTLAHQGYLGQIDQFRVFNKEVSASEVTTLYNEGI